MSDKKTKIIAIANQKGGVAKTTTAVNLSAALAMSGLKVALIDLDPQGNASTGLGIDPQDRVHTIYHVLINNKNICEATYSTAISNLDIIPSDIDLSAAEVELLQFENKDFVLKKALRSLPDNKYDFIIIDCPPSLGQLTINALTAANAILIPMQCEFYALEGLSHLLKSIELIQGNLNRDLKIFGVVLSMYDKRNRLTEQVADDVKACLGDLVFETVIPRNIRITEAPSHGMPVIIYDPNCIGSKAYQELAREIIIKEKLVFS